jgi:hypothetical protein
MDSGHSRRHNGNGRMSLEAVWSIRVAADPDTAFYFDADPDPTFHSYADPDPDPTFHSDADPDPAFTLMRFQIPDPDPTFQFDCRSGSYH